jgi:hypothetical protein
MKNIKVYFTAVLMLILFSCKYELPEEPIPAPPSAGSINFNKYIAIGDGITAGFMHASLYPEGQESSYPKLLSLKIMQVHDITFNQPLLASPTGNGFNPVHSQPAIGLFFGRLEMVKPVCIQSSITAVVTPGDPPVPYTGNKEELNNFGVTGLKMAEIIFPGYGTLNPFFGRFAIDAATSSVLGDAALKQPTFFTLWLGNQDILGYATAGGTGNIEGMGQYDMTPVNFFTGSLDATLNTLIPAGSDVKGMVGNIPDVLSWPFFYTVNNSLQSGQKLPFNLTQGQADTLNFMYLQSTGTNPEFSGGSNNYFVIVTATGIRQMNPAEDFILLSVPSDSLGTGPIDPCNPAGAQRAGWGITKPIPDQYVLDVNEVDIVRTRTGIFNDVIMAETNSRTNVALVDMNSLLRQLNTNGVSAGIGTIKANIPFGGAISLDGLHPTPKGNVVFANKFIEAINSNFNANLHYLNPNEYKGIEIP